jgi:hypothetical protein
MMRLTIERGTTAVVRAARQVGSELGRREPVQVERGNGK